MSTFSPQSRRVFAATSLLFAMACGANVPAKPDAASVIAKAIESTLTRELPAVTYCMTANPDFTFVNMGQTDLVATFENVLDKSPLYEAATAGVIRVELKEFRFDPAARSPHPACDAIHAQSKQNGLQRDQIRLAVVWTTVTEKGAAAGVRLDTPIDVATRALVDVTDIRPDRGGSATVAYTWKWAPTKMAEALGYTPADAQAATARLKQATAGWVVEDTGLKR